MQTLPLKKGEIVLTEEGIQINDNGKRELQLRIFSSVLWIVFGAFSVLRYFNGEGDSFLLWTSLLIGLGHLTVLVIYAFFRTNKRTISISEIRDMRMRTRGDNTFLEIKLQQGRLRRVNQVHEIAGELHAYIADHLKPSKLN